MRSHGIAAACIALMIVPAARAAPVVTQVGTLAKPAAGIASGPDGALWVTEPYRPGRLARVTTAGAVTEYPAGVTPGFTSDRQPGAMTVGPDGALWFVEQTGYVGRVTPGGAVSEFGPLGGTPVAIATGRDGNLWVAEHSALDPNKRTSALARITPTGDLTEFPIGNGRPSALTAGADGALWYANDEGLGRMTTVGDVSTFAYPSPPLGVATGPDGALWFTAGDRVGRMTTTGVLSDWLPGISYATAIAAGPDGAMWFTLKDAVGRLLPDGTVTTHPLAGSAGTGITAGPDGAMWFTAGAALGRVTVPPYLGQAGASNVSTAGAQVDATVRANALPATVRVQVRDAGGALVAEQAQVVAPGPEDLAVAFAISGLAEGTPYTATVSATSDAGDALAPAQATFTTARTPAASPTPTPEPTATQTPEPTPPPSIEPVPVRQETVVLRVNRGEVRIKPKGQGRFTTVEDPTSLPVGGLIDTRRGEVQLDSALTGEETQAGFFSGGLFRVRQAPKGMTSLIVKGSISCPSSTLASASKKKGKRRRKLWGRDSGGKFRTHGRDSVATVRGTHWLTIDTCRGTATRVVEGEVAVRPKRGKHRKPVILTAGERYLVRHG